ncbi:hypothetical protein HDV00_000920 [Rhizophlyctis rosea]|nr:hypothetical protein HDV00_000920 [Rhizophlyctis rosea]
MKSGEHKVILVNAKAGSGKTTTLIESLAHIPPRKANPKTASTHTSSPPVTTVALLAFNRSNADLLELRVEKLKSRPDLNLDHLKFTSQTFHSIGFSLLRNDLGAKGNSIVVEESKTSMILQYLQCLPEYANITDNSPDFYHWVTQLVSKAKLHGLVPRHASLDLKGALMEDTEADWRKLLDLYQIIPPWKNISEAQDADVIRMSQACLIESFKWAGLLLRDDKGDTYSMRDVNPTIRQIRTRSELRAVRHLISEKHVGRKDGVPSDLRLLLNTLDSGQYILDFDEMLYFPIVCDVGVPCFDVVLVDEAQDMSEVRAKFVERISQGEDSRVVLYGDKNQNIFQFAGCTSNLFQGLHTWGTTGWKGEEGGKVVDASRFIDELDEEKREGGDAVVMKQIGEMEKTVGGGVCGEGEYDPRAAVNRLREFEEGHSGEADVSVGGGFGEMEGEGAEGGDEGLGHGRTIVLQNLPRDIRVSEIRQYIRGGPLEKIEVLGEEGECVRVVFLHAEDAGKFYAFHERIPLSIDDRRVITSFGDPSELGHDISAALGDGASRRLRVDDLPDTITVPELEEVFGAFGELVEMDVWEEEDGGKRVAEVEFRRIQSAILAVESWKRGVEGVGFRVVYMPDPCAEELPDGDWEGDVEGVEGGYGGEMVGGQERGDIEWKEDGSSSHDSVPYESPNALDPHIPQASEKLGESAMKDEALGSSYASSDPNSLSGNLPTETSPTGSSTSSGDSKAAEMDVEVGGVDLAEGIRRDWSIPETLTNNPQTDTSLKGSSESFSDSNASKADSDFDELDSADNIPANWPIPKSSSDNPQTETSPNDSSKSSSESDAFDIDEDFDSSESTDAIPPNWPIPKTLDLSVCHRCPQEVIKLAQRIVPGIKWAPDAPVGQVQLIGNDYGHSLFRNKHGMIISRNAVELVNFACYLLAHRIHCEIAGRKVGKNLEEVIRWAGASDEDTIGTLSKKILARRCRVTGRNVWRLGRVLGSGGLQGLDDRIDSLMMIAKGNFAPECYVYELRRLVEDLKWRGIMGSRMGEKGSESVDQYGRLLLCTMHRSRGLERDDVFLINEANHFTDFDDLTGEIRLPPRKSSDPEWNQQAEKNLRYIAVTRARKRVWCVDWCGGDERVREFCVVKSRSRSEEVVFGRGRWDEERLRPWMDLGGWMGPGEAEEVRRVREVEEVREKEREERERVERERVERERVEREREEREERERREELKKARRGRVRGRVYDARSGTPPLSNDDLVEDDPGYGEGQVAAASA